MDLSARGQGSAARSTAGDPLASAAFHGEATTVLEEAAREAVALADARSVVAGLAEATSISIQVWNVEEGDLGRPVALLVPFSALEPVAAAVRSGQPVNASSNGSSSATVPTDIAVPLIAGDGVIGVIGIQGARSPGQLLEPLTRIAARTALAIEYVRLRRRFRTSLHETVTVLAALIEGRDAYTESHCVHLAEMSLAIGVRMGLTEDRLEHLSFGGLLHDIGKIAVPDAILTKPAPLTEREYDEMKAHAAIGEEILHRIGALATVAPIVGQHHERIDGSGYPRGLRGESILLEARILAVVDTFDAMTTARPYRAALPWSRAVDVITVGAGSKFDRDVVDVFLKYVKGEEAQWKNASPI